MGDSFVVRTSDFVEVDISNSDNDHIIMQKRFPKSITILEFKEKLEIMTGGSSQTMKIQLFKDKKFVGDLDNDEALLGSYHIDSGMRVHVIAQFSYETNVEKFELSNDQYEKKTDSVRNFLKTNKLGKYDEEEEKRIKEKKENDKRLEIEKANTIKLGDRCEVTVKSQPKRKGTVMYNGVLEGQPGLFIGVKYDEPLGKNDGSFGDKRYFECKPKYGGFVKPIFVEVGDFPEEDFNIDDEI